MEPRIVELKIEADDAYGRIPTAALGDRFRTIVIADPACQRRASLIALARLKVSFCGVESGNGREELRKYPEV
jgi:hypothetical protein